MIAASRAKDPARMLALGALALAMAAMVGARPAPAQAQAAGDLYAAAYAEQMCGGADFSQEQWGALVRKIGESGTEGNILAQMEEAEDKVAAIQHHRGCEAGEIQEWRQVFSQQLASAL